MFFKKRVRGLLNDEIACAAGLQGRLSV